MSGLIVSTYATLCLFTSLTAFMTAVLS